MKNIKELSKINKNDLIQMYIELQREHVEEARYESVTRVRKIQHWTSALNVVAITLTIWFCISVEAAVVMFLIIMLGIALSKLERHS